MTAARVRVRRAVGIALVASGAVFLFVAALAWTRVLPVHESVRPVLASAVLVAGVADVIIGLRFTGGSDL